MRGRELLRIALATVAVAVVLGACSGGSSGSGSESARSSWDSHASTKLRAVATRFTNATPGQCKDYTELPATQYTTSAAKSNLPIPGVVADCTAFTETFEWYGFTSDGAGAQFARQQADALCAKAKVHKVIIPGFQFVVGPTWAVLPDTEASARRTAQSLQAKYLPITCPGRSAVQWDNAGVARAQQLVSNLHAAGVTCANFSLIDREDIVGTPAYAHVGVPAAYGQCSISGKPVALIVFGPTGAKQGPFTAVDAKQRICSPVGGVVSGPDFSMLVTTPSQAKLVADALHANVGVPSCT
jgi:hypothetical protein